jgi:hypothetical protein
MENSRDCNARPARLYVERVDAHTVLWWSEIHGATESLGIFPVNLN